MQQSYFHYNLSRPLPFRWFTWLVVIGGSITLVLLSLLNFAANGYDLQISYTDNPNQTFSGPKWMQHWPFDSMQRQMTSCQARDIGIGTEFVTNTTAVIYTLNTVKTVANGKTIPFVVSSSLQYKHNVLQDCTVPIIELEISPDEDASTWGPKTFVRIICYVETLQGRLEIALDSQYDKSLTRRRPGDHKRFLKANVKTRASLWWGSYLTSEYWNQIDSKLRATKTSHQLKWALIDLAASDHHNITSPSFFTATATLDYDKATSDNSSSALVRAHKFGNRTIETLIQEKAAPGPEIWNSIDRYGKAIHSMILADVGQKSTSNLLLPLCAPELREYFTLPKYNKSKSLSSPATVLVQHGYDDVVRRNLTGPLSIQPSVIAGQYLCQRPVQKPWGPLMITILAADFALAQVLWSLLKLCVTELAEQRDPKAMHCIGCLEKMKEGAERSPESVTMSSQDNQLSVRNRFSSHTRRSNTLPALWRDRIFSDGEARTDGAQRPSESTLNPNNLQGTHREWQPLHNDPISSELPESVVLPRRTSADH